ncbi:MAG: NAD(P)-binding domain-containing protein, partial [Alphaproteobacteria bacterium]|nr:NAD(P)-binding domain-containing protein [Alphaproteobacteria bacterium]
MGAADAGGRNGRANRRRFRATAGGRPYLPGLNFECREKTMAIIGFIGLGNMGGPMAENLLKAGHELRVFDLAQTSVDKAVAAGASAAASIPEVVKGAEVVVTMLPAGPHVRAVLTDGGALANADYGTLFIECSTIDVDTARAMHAAATEAGMEMVDAPVSGGTAGAAGATLTFMMGGSEAAY